MIQLGEADTEGWTDADAKSSSPFAAAWMITHIRSRLEVKILVALQVLWQCEGKVAPGIVALQTLHS